MTNTLTKILDHIGFDVRPQQLALYEALMGTNWTGTVAQAGTGCIQGDAEIIINRGGNGVRRTLRELVHKFNGGVDERGKRWKLDIPTMVQREAEDGTIRLAKLRAAWFSGTKFTYTVTTSTGRQIRATDEHPFLTERGWLRLDEIVVGDLVHVRGEQAAGVRRQPKPQYRQVHGLVGHPYASRRGYKRHGYRYPQHRLVIEAEMNALDYDVYIKRLRVDDVDGLKFLDPELYAVHHIDRDSLNNDRANLQVMTHEDHHRLHADLGKTRSALYKAVTEEVVSVEPFGLEETYDLEVEDDPHNFIANGFVVHNTGKSLAVLAAAADFREWTGKPSIVVVPTNILLQQYVRNDAPHVAEALGITIKSLMGRNRYLCSSAPGFAGLTRLPDKVIAAEPDQNELLWSGDIVEAADPYWFGCPGSDECRGREDTEVCHYRAAKAELEDADIIITNAHLLIIDDQLKGKPPLEVERDGEMVAWQPAIFPDYGAIFVDEAHTLEDNLRSFATRSIPAGAVEGFELYTWLRMHFNADAFTVSPDKKLVEMLREVMGREAVDLKKHQKEAVKAAEYIITRGKDGAYAEGEAVLWFDPPTKQGGQPKLVSTQINLAGGARRLLTQVPFGLVSGTIPKSLRNALGIADTRFIDVGHPFSYDKQVKLKISHHSGAYQAAKDPKNMARRALEIRDIVVESGGGALLLFSSYRDMEWVHREIAPYLEQDAGLDVRTQTREGDKKELGEWFRTHGNAVLFGTESFATGFDVPGDALRLVCIWKVPFPGIDPVTNAIKKRSYSRYEDMALMKITQAAGRLIRTSTDTGTIFIADSRAEDLLLGRDDPMLQHFNDMAYATSRRVEEDVY